MDVLTFTLSFSIKVSVLKSLGPLCPDPLVIKYNRIVCIYQTLHCKAVIPLTVLINNRNSKSEV